MASFNVAHHHHHRYTMQRPENALKKANEFIEVDKPSRALDTLYDVVKGKRHRMFSEKVMEPIMMKYLELCVELRKVQIAKEGLYQYRIMCQSVGVELLEKVIRFYINAAEQKAENAKALIESKTAAAREQSEPLTSIAEVDDLDNLSMADMTLLNLTTEEQAQERSDRAVVIPWVKFLWESYTQCLDLLRNNARLEHVYHDLAQRAFGFCLNFNRKTEFRKLCERLRKHFDDIIKHYQSGKVQVNNVDFGSSETQQLHMETRLTQLDSAISLELWQEAYKAIEDIHLIMSQSRKCQSRMMAFYYQKLSLVFWKSENQLFHAATLIKYYQLCKEMKKNVSAEELRKYADQAVLATLSIPYPIIHSEYDRFIETDRASVEKNHQKLANLLFLSQPPNRASLLRDVNRLGILGNASEDLQKLYDLFDNEFSPLDFCEKVEKMQNSVVEASPELGQYSPSVRHLTLVHLIRQVALVYDNISFEHLLNISGCSPENQMELEQILVDEARYNEMRVRIDHQTNCVHFGRSDLSSSSLAEDSLLTYGDVDGTDTDGRILQMPSEAVRGQLVNVMNILLDAVDSIKPKSKIAAEENIRKKIIHQFHQSCRYIHCELEERNKMIMRRREELQRSMTDRDKQMEEQAAIQKILEAKRLEAEREERERKKLELEEQELKQRQIQDKIDRIGRTKIGLRVIEKITSSSGGDITTPRDLDLDTVLQMQQEELQKEARTYLLKMKSQEKRLDHFERAKRNEEIPLIEQQMIKRKTADQLDWDQHENDRIKKVIQDRNIAVKNGARLERMRESKETFLKIVVDARRDEFLKRLEKFQKNFDEKKAERLALRAADRKEERRRKYEEERLIKEEARLEALRKAREEKERAERERLQRELEEKNRIVLEKQLAKEREIEERMLREKERERVREKERERQQRDREQQQQQQRSRNEGSLSWRRYDQGQGGPPSGRAGTGTGGEDVDRDRSSWRSASKGSGTGTPWRRGGGSGSGGGASSAGADPDNWRRPSKK